LRGRLFRTRTGPEKVQDDAVEKRGTKRELCSKNKPVVIRTGVRTPTEDFRFERGRRKKRGGEFSSLVGLPSTLREGELQRRSTDKTFRVENRGQGKLDVSKGGVTHLPE